MSLKQKTVNGLVWSFVDSFANQGINFVVGIILARLLSPDEFGLIGMITIVISLSGVFIDSGFSNALICKKEVTQADYSTVFFFNLFVGVLAYFALFFSAGAISLFFQEPELKPLVQVLGLSILISSLTLIQRVQLTKRIDFKLQTRISVIASVCSGFIGITMAYYGYGVWSLVYKQLAQEVLISLFFWLWNGWKPSWIFDKASFKEMFGFGSKLLASSLIDTIYQNIYYLIIGKYFSAAELGYYTRADQFRKLPSQNITGVIQRVSYPVLASIKDDVPRLKASYKKLIKGTMLISFVLMIGMAAVAEPMVHTLIGDKWLPSVVYLQLLCFVGMFYPIQALNLNMLNVQGRSDLFLRLEIIKKLLAIPTIIAGIYFGIKVMIMGMMVNTLIAYYLNSYWSGKFIEYSIVEQIKDILPAFILASVSGIVVYFTGEVLNTSHVITLAIQITVGALFTIGVAEMIKLEDYLYLKGILIEKFTKPKYGASVR
ncbi:MAG: MOP flippase family protein [Chlorobiales bacterium]|nr:MOP flippase family protein [Chlorobiales bacterium]